MEETNKISYDTFINELEIYCKYPHRYLSYICSDELQDIYNNLTEEEQQRATEEHKEQINNLFTPIHKKDYKKN